MRTPRIPPNVAQAAAALLNPYLSAPVEPDAIGPALAEATRPPEPAPAGKLLSIVEAAERLSVCRRTVWNLIDSGRLRKVSIGKAARVPLADVLRMVEG